jgi:hypothetical protein
MSNRLYRGVRWFAILVPLLSVGLSACVVVPARPVAYYGDRDDWRHERHEWR